MPNKYDILIKDVSIIDGTGKPGYAGSIGVRGDKIAAIGALQGNAGKTIEGKGLVACPGFIDAHSHADLSILNDPYTDNLIRQGITTFCGGHCGASLAPSQPDAQAAINLGTFGDFLDRVQQSGLTPNYIPLVGHNAIRQVVLGKYYARKASSAEIDAMKNILREALESGCFGMSVGLDGGMPGHFADIEELVALVKIVKEYGGIFAPHTRHHQNQWPAQEPGESAYGIFDAPAGEIITGRYHGLLEAVEISRLAGNARLHIAHMTPAYIVPQPHPAFLDEALAKATIADIIESAEAAGLDISYNVIPSESSIGGRQPIIGMFFDNAQNRPKWLRDLDAASFALNLKCETFRAKVKTLMLSGKIKVFMVHPLTDPYWMDSYLILDCRNKAYEGKTLWQIAREREPTCTIKAVYDGAYDALFNILAEDPAATWTLVKDKREYGAFHVFLSDRRGIPCTDYFVAEPVNNYGASPALCNMFPMYLQAMVKEKKLLSLEEAIRKITSFPATRLFGLNDRGVLRKNACADIVVMDFENLKPHNDFRNPQKPADGIKYVIINGRLACDNGLLTRVKNGKILQPVSSLCHAHANVEISSITRSNQAKNPSCTPEDAAAEPRHWKTRPGHKRS